MEKDEEAYRPSSELCEDTEESVRGFLKWSKIT
jgi:hypothetical protein